MCFFFSFWLGRGGRAALAENQNQQTTQEQPVVSTNTTEEKPSPTVSATAPDETKQNISTTVESAVNNDVALSNKSLEKTEGSVDTTTKGKVSNILGKFKNLKFKKSSLKGIKLPKSPVKNKSNSLNYIYDKKKI